MTMRMGWKMRDAKGTFFWNTPGLFPGLIGIALLGCSGGEGSGGRADEDPAPSYLAQRPEPAASAEASAWASTLEYQNSVGLGPINAAEAYALRAGGTPAGAGIRVAIIDSGIDHAHPDLGNLADAAWRAGNEPAMDSIHATFVAGIIGATRSQSSTLGDMHGVAYRATLVDIQAARPSAAEDGRIVFFANDVDQAIRAAAGDRADAQEFEADILNLSLGAYADDPMTFSTIREGMEAAAARGKIMVLAAGNEGQAADPARRAQPIFPAAYADDPGIAGLAIVVGNATLANEASDTSNHCGATRNYCLFAPGSSIRSTMPGGGYGIGSGSSFATPHVAGAAAVVKSAFPGVSNQEIVDRLLRTAQDLGSDGTDSLYGRGLLDLEAAMSPLGEVGLPLGGETNGPRMSAQGSALLLGQGWGIDPEAKALLARAVGFDRMGFPFPLGLDQRLSKRRSTKGMAALRPAPRPVKAARWTAAPGVSIAMLAEEAKDPETAPPDQGRWPAHETDQPMLDLQSELKDKVTLFAAAHGQPATVLDLENAVGRAWPAAMPSLVTPFAQLLGETTGGGAAWHVTESTSLALGAWQSDALYDEGALAAGRRLTLRQRIGSGEWRLGYGRLAEDNRFLASQASGVFGTDLKADTDYFSTSFLLPVSKATTLYASYAAGRSRSKTKDDGLARNWSAVRTSAFAIGLSHQGLLREDDRLGVVFGQPLRVEEGKVDVTVPVGRTIDGRVRRQSHRADLRPDGRELRLGIAYDMPLDKGDGGSLSGELTFRLHPDHESTSPPEVGFGLRYRLPF